MCTFDCTKSFDKVTLALLFIKPREYNPLVLRCLIYSLHIAIQQCALFQPLIVSHKEDCYPTRYLMFFLNEVLSKLRENGLGCHMNGQLCSCG